MRARNRDVARPPFPETRGGRLAMEQCPPLYEVQQCIIQLCPENATSPNQLLGTLELTTIANNLVALDTKQTNKPETALKNEENVQKSITSTRTLDLAPHGMVGFSPSVTPQGENKAADSTTPSPLSASTILVLNVQSMLIEDFA